MDKQIVVITGAELQELIENSVSRAIAKGQKLESQNQGEYLTIHEACAFLSLAPQTIYGLTSRKKIPHYKSGKKIYFIKKELIEWLNQGKQAVKSKPEIKLKI